MKVVCQYGVRGLSGKIDNSVFYYHPGIQRSLMRKYVVPDNAKNTNRTKAIMANLQHIQPSHDYIVNFKAYMYKYSDLKEFQHKPMASWYNLYIKMLFAMQKTMPDVNLRKITREQIYEQNLPCKTVCAAIEAGLIPEVEDYQRYINEI